MASFNAQLASFKAKVASAGSSAASAGSSDSSSASAGSGRDPGGPSSSKKSRVDSSPPPPRPLPPPVIKDRKDLTVDLSFMVIGAQKAGTTWVHEMLSRHPAFHLPTNVKELHFFDWHRKKGLGWYSREFRRPGVTSTATSTSTASSSASSAPTQFMGEVTPCYAALSSSRISEIRALFPSLRVVFFARPIPSRAWSAVMMELRNEVHNLKAGEFASSNEVYDRLDMCDPEKKTDEYFIGRITHKDHMDRSDYGSAIKRWLLYYPPESIGIFEFDRIKTDPKGLLRDVLTFISAGRPMPEPDFFERIGDEVLGTKFNAKVEKVDKDAKKGGAAAEEEPAAEEGMTEGGGGPGTKKKEDPELAGVRPSLRTFMDKHFEPYTADFNKLLEELGYEWRLT